MKPEIFSEIKTVPSYINDLKDRQTHMKNPYQNMKLKYAVR